VAMLADMLASRGETIPTGTFIMTGAITEAIAVDVGDTVTAKFQHLGSVTTRFA